MRVRATPPPKTTPATFPSPNSAYSRTVLISLETKENQRSQHMSEGSRGGLESHFIEGSRQASDQWVVGQKTVSTVKR
jgi:hypothetical protein